MDKYGILKSGQRKDRPIRLRADAQDDLNDCCAHIELSITCFVRGDSS